MADTYTQYESECKRIRKENAKLIEQFADWLTSKGLSEKTIEKHCCNIEFYVNEFLLYEDIVRPEDGAHKAGMFLGYWFIRKAMWATSASIKSNAVSLKKFYTFMLEKGTLEKEDLDDLKKCISAHMPEWLATLARYDNPDMDASDNWVL